MKRCITIADKPYFFTYKPSDFFSIFSEIWEIFNEKQGSANSRGSGIKKQLLNLKVLPFFFGQQESVGRSLTFRVSAYSLDLLIDEAIW